MFTFQFCETLFTFQNTSSVSVEHLYKTFIYKPDISDKPPVYSLNGKYELCGIVTPVPSDHCSASASVTRSLDILERKNIRSPTPIALIYRVIIDFCIFLDSLLNNSQPSIFQIFTNRPCLQETGNHVTH